MLARVIQKVIAKNIVVVAAAGNQGPGAEPVYPAAYPGVIAVTAVDHRLNIYRRATRGDYVDLAAPGVDIWTADSSHGEPRSGTSYAVPFGSAAAAILRSTHPELSAAQVESKLTQSALDLGEAGWDTTYGWGLVQAGTLCPAPDGLGPSAKLP